VAGYSTALFAVALLTVNCNSIRLWDSERRPLRWNVCLCYVQYSSDEPMSWD